jgi:hypothetical protein
MRFFNFLRPSDAVQENRIISVWSIATAVLYVVALWGAGMEEQGLNAAAYLFAVLGLFLWTMRRRGLSLAANLYWIVPVALICFSYLLYTNPFIKVVNFLVLPVVVTVFYGLAFVPAERSFRWSAGFALASVARLFSPVAKIAASSRVFASLWSSARHNRSTVNSIVLGVALMLGLVVAVVLPLLSSADAGFNQLVSSFLEWVGNLIEPETAARILVGFLLSVITVAALLAWGREPSVKQDEKAETPLDSIVIGIVLGGTLVVYLVFLLLQAKNLVVGQLPFDFGETVRYVKSGFWQLIALSVINITVFTLAYRRTVPVVQSILAAFAVASVLLVASAAHRMGLYVTYYGLSYEKFYACLAVVFCIALFGYLLTCLIRRRDADVLRFAAVTFIWMYAVAAIFPIEHFVMRTNVALSKMPGSHVRLYELTMLSSDVAGLVSARLEDGTLLANERATNLRLSSTDDEILINGWKNWLERHEIYVTNKAWYQLNLSDVFTRLDIAGK